MKLTFRILSTAAVLFLASPGLAAEAKEDKQRKHIAVLQSDAAPGEKGLACKQLAIYGTREAVPALAPLLENKDLASWSRIALEAIPGPEAGEALRNAVPKLQGLLLIGAINSIGVRRDAKAVDLLAGKLADPDAEIVAAAAAALGKIGGPQSAKALSQALAGNRKEAVSEGAILCAEQFLNDGKLSDAAQLYDTVRKAEVSKQRQLEATRGAILAREAKGLPLLLEQLRSGDKNELAMALRTARELIGREVTDALGAEMDRVQDERQVMLLLAIADRNDDAVLPKLLKAAEKGAKPTRIAAVSLLDQRGRLFAVPVLLNAAIDPDADLARPAKATLTRMEGKAVDDALLSRLPQATGKTRQVIIELAAARRIHGAVPALISSAEDSDPGVRKAAYSTLSALGSEQQVPDLVRLLSKSRDQSDREGLERALTDICGRAGAKCLPQTLPLAKHNDPEVRMAGLRVLATVGGPEALSAVASAIQDSDESVQDEAVNTLSTWPNNWPDDATVAEPLLALAKTGRKPAYKIQGIRGYFLHLQENKKLSAADKLKAVDRLLPSLQQPQEKRLAITTLGGIPTARSLELLTAFAEDPALTEEAALAIVNVAAKEVEGAGKEARQKALQVAADKAKNEATRNKAAAALKSLQ